MRQHYCGMEKKLHFMRIGLAVTLVAGFATGCSLFEGPSAEQAISAFKAHDYEAARGYLAKARRDAPDNKDIIMLSGKNALILGDLELATTEFNTLKSDAQYGEESTALLAKAKLVAGNPDLALQILGEAPPANGVAAATLVMANIVTGQSKLGMEQLKQFSDQFPDSMDMIMVKGTLAGSMGDLPTARAIADQLIKAWPDEPEALIFAGRTALAQGRIEQADRHFTHLLEMVPNSDIGLVAKASVELDRGNKADAQALLNKALTRTSGNVPARYLLADLAIEAGNVDAASEALRGTEDAYEMLPGLAMLKGLVEAQRDNHETAIADLRRYFALGGDEARARIAIARSLVLTNRADEAWDYLKPVADGANANASVLELATKLAEEVGDPGRQKYAARLAQTQRKDPDADRMIAAERAMRMGDWKSADTNYTPLLSGNSTNIVLLNNAANVRLNLGRVDDAIGLARQAHNLAPDDPIVLDTLAWCLFKKQGPSAEVVALANKAYAARPGNPEIQAHMMQIGAATRSRTPS